LSDDLLNPRLSTQRLHSRQTVNERIAVDHLIHGDRADRVTAAITYTIQRPQISKPPPASRKPIRRTRNRVLFIEHHPRLVDRCLNSERSRGREARP
jgi:hypothetical protein